MKSLQLAVCAHGLTKRYKNVEVVHHLNLRVPTGHVYGFLGPNGAGKSTTMKLLLGLARPTSGTVEILGEQFTSRSARRILPRVGSLIESPSFYGHISGRENLDIVRRIKQAPASSVDNVLDVVRLGTAADKRAKEYSLGMKQRLGIAMALLGSPELLILDEPTNGLDPAGMHEMRQLITQLPAMYGLTVIVSSHLLSEIEQMADMIGIINHGQLVYQGSLAQLEDDGHLVLVVERAQEAAALINSAGYQVDSVDGSAITLPVYADEYVSEMVRIIVNSGIGIYRVEVRKQTLEQKFLQLTGQIHQLQGLG